MTPKLLTEFVGALLFLFTISLAVTGAQPLAGLIIGGALMVLVYMGGHVSGAHYNPAVSLAVLLRGKMTVAEFAPYLVAQIGGAIAGCLLAYLASGKTFAPAPGDGVTFVQALIVEATFTFALSLVVLNVATSKGTSGNSFYGAAIGTTIMAAAFAGGGTSGGVYNPAVALGSTIVHAALGGGSLRHLGLYLIGPFLGGALAAWVFRIQNPADH